MPSFRFATPVLVLALAACGGSGGSGPGPSDAGLDSANEDAAPATDAAPEPEPRIVFLAPSDAGPVPVTSILYARLAWVRVEGLAPGGEATLRSRMWGYRGWARFVADDAGTIDTSRDAPVEGTYEGVEPEGLVWSMLAETDETAESFDVAFDLERDGQTIASATLERRPLSDGLVREDVREDGLVGVFYRPEGAGPHPAVLVLGGSEGGIPELDAAFEASYGIAALGLAYFGEEGLPTSLTDVPLETFGTALDWLAARPEIDPDRIAVAGASRGGELVLQLAALYPQIVATIAEVPSGVRWGSAGLPGRAAWTLGGEPLPYVDGDAWDQTTEEWLWNDNRGVRASPAYIAILAEEPAEEIAAATIDVDAATGPILLIGGADDGLWPSCTLAQIAVDRLVESGHFDAEGDAFHCYPDAGHWIGMPGWPTLETYAIRPPYPGPWWVLGGTQAGTAHAQREVFEETRALWGRVFGMELR